MWTRVFAAGPGVARVARRVAARDGFLEGTGQLGGFVAFEYGLWQVWEPLAWLVGGPVVMLAAYGLARPAGGGAE